LCDALQLKVDGGVSQSDLLLQIQSDVLGLPVERPADTETTVRGAAMVAALAAGVWTLGDGGARDVRRLQEDEEVHGRHGHRRHAAHFEPKLSPELREQALQGWAHAVSLSFA